MQENYTETQKNSNAASGSLDVLWALYGYSLWVFSGYSLLATNGMSRITSRWAMRWIIKKVMMMENFQTSVVNNRSRITFIVPFQAAYSIHWEDFGENFSVKSSVRTSHQRLSSEVLFPSTFRLSCHFDWMASNRLDAVLRAQHFGERIRKVCDHPGDDKQTSSVWVNSFNPRTGEVSQSAKFPRECFANVCQKTKSRELVKSSNLAE